MEESGLYVGIDIGLRITQIAVYNEEKYEPVCVGEYPDENRNYIPTEPDLSDNERLMLFLKQCLSVARKYGGDYEIAGLVVTMRDVDKELSDRYKEIFASVGLDKEKVSIQNYRQSYMYFVLNQKQDIWVNDVGLFDYDTGGLKYYQMTVDRRRTPYIAGIMEKDYSGSMQYGNEQEFLFENIAENALHKQILSTIYMTGSGFDSGWADDSMRKLSRGSRIFKGSNLYVKGACYAARSRAGLGIMPECLFIDDDMIRVHVSTNVYVRAESQEIILAKAGTRWYEADSSLYIIPDDENELQINVTNVITRDHMKHLIPLDIINKDRANMTTRLRLRVRFQDVNRCIVTIKDEGFGEICPSSGRIYEKILQVD